MEKTIIITNIDKIQDISLVDDADIETRILPLFGGEGKKVGRIDHEPSRTKKTNEKPKE